MQPTQRYFLRKEHRLKSRKAIEQLFKTGNSFSNFPFRICWQFAEGDIGIKAGFTASSKNFKYATDRNRIKRLIREAYRLQKNELQNTITTQNKALHLFVIFVGKDVPSYNIVFEKMDKVLNRLLKIVHESAE